MSIGQIGLKLLTYIFFFFFAYSLSRSRYIESRNNGNISFFIKIYYMFLERVSFESNIFTIPTYYTKPYK